jgi:hypothetical protein
MGKSQSRKPSAKKSSTKTSTMFNFFSLISVMQGRDAINSSLRFHLDDLLSKYRGIKGVKRKDAAIKREDSIKEFNVLIQKSQPIRECFGMKPTFEDKSIRNFFESYHQFKMEEESAMQSILDDVFLEDDISSLSSTSSTSL